LACGKNRRHPAKIAVTGINRAGNPIVRGIFLAIFQIFPALNRVGSAD